MKAYLALALAAVASIGMTASPQTVSAGEFAAMDCGELWVARNQIYKDNGYCFTSARAITYFGYGGCQYHSTGALPLSSYDRTLLRRIKESESGQRC